MIPTIKVFRRCLKVDAYSRSRIKIHFLKHFYDLHSGGASFFFSGGRHPAEKFGGWAAKMCIISDKKNTNFCII